MTFLIALNLLTGGMFVLFAILLVVMHGQKNHEVAEGCAMGAMACAIPYLVTWWIMLKPFILAR